MWFSLLPFVALYVVLVACYRLFFHPLRPFPGPSIAALTGFYQLYYNLIRQGKLLSQIEYLHAIYGPVVRIGPNSLHFNDAKAYHDIYGSLMFTKDPEFYRGVFVHCTDSSAGFYNPREAKTRRQIINPLFSRQAIMRLEGFVQEKVDKLISRLSSYNQPIRMSLAYRCTALDIITSYCFATCFNALDAPLFMDPIVRGVQDIIVFVWVLRYFHPLVSVAFALPSKVVATLYPPFSAAIHMRASIDAQVESLLSDKSALSSVEHETVYHHLLAPESKDASGGHISRKSLTDEGVLLINAGGDTVGDACMVGTFYALKNSGIYQKLKTELCQAWPDEEAPLSYQELEKLPYLTAFLKESLRFSHGVVTPLPRKVGPSDSMIAGIKVPAGTTVAMSAAFLHRNPDVFEDPERFWPERWLHSDTKDMAQTFVPFSKGPRVCPGMNLAWCELYLIFGNVFRKLELTLHVTDETIPDFYNNVRELFTPHWDKDYEVIVQTH